MDTLYFNSINLLRYYTRDRVWIVVIDCCDNGLIIDGLEICSILQNFTERWSFKIRGD